jgi:hypothetical protein
MAVSTRVNSTNVRKQSSPGPSPLDPWPLEGRFTARAPALVLAAWALFVSIASVEGVFARLESEACVALAAFVVAFMLGASRIDEDAAALLSRVSRPLALALALDVLLVLGPLEVTEAPWLAFPGGLLVVLVLPMALVLHAEALGRPRIRKAAGASPGARRAAT